MRSADVREADFVFVSHTHLDHVLGADVIARTTGAPVIGSHETIRVMRECGVPEEQCWAVSGGETVAVRRGRVRARAAGAALVPVAARGRSRRTSRSAAPRRRDGRRAAAHAHAGGAALPGVPFAARPRAPTAAAVLPAEHAGGERAVLLERGLLDGVHARPAARPRDARGRRAPEPRRRALPRRHGALHRRRGRAAAPARDRALPPRRVDAADPAGRRSSRSSPRSRAARPRVRIERLELGQPIEL